MRATVSDSYNAVAEREIRIHLRAIVPRRPPLLRGVEISFGDRGP